MIDTHAHLDRLVDPDGAVARARAAGVTRILAVGTGLASWRACLALARRHDEVLAVLGVPPHEGEGEEAGRLDELRALLADERVVAVGETGLDFHWDGPPRERQAALFAAQLELAAETGKPVVIHTRAAEEETARALAGFAGTVVLHCFSCPALLGTALERGYYVSFAGNVTYPGAGDLRLAAARVPPDRLLCETDAPYLAPQPRRGRPNEPAYLVHTVAALAAARGEEPAALARRLADNARAAFRLP